MTINFARPNIICPEDAVKSAFSHLLSEDLIVEKGQFAFFARNLIEFVCYGMILGATVMFCTLSTVKLQGITFLSHC